MANTGLIRLEKRNRRQQENLQKENVAIISDLTDLLIRIDVLLHKTWFILNQRFFLNILQVTNSIELLNGKRLTT